MKNPMKISLGCLFLLWTCLVLPTQAQDNALPENTPIAPPSPAPSETPLPEAAPATAPPASSTPQAAAPSTSESAQVATPPAPENNPAPSDEFSQKVLPPEPVKKIIPTAQGDRSGTVWVGHRAVIDRYAGWGWIKKEREPWSRGRWVMLEETIGKSVAPGRHYSRPTQDDGMTYRLFGDFAEYKGYEPNYDVFVDVFRIKGWETVGREKRPDLRPPRGSAGGPPRWSERGANMRR
jgi:hypothetical protein